MLYAAFIILMIFLARAAGGGFGAEYLRAKEDGGAMPFNLSFLPEIIFGISFGAASYVFSGNFFYAACVSIWCYLWMETGHGTVLQWGADPQAAKGERRHTLTPVVEWICRQINARTDFYIEFGDINYCRIFMAVKGFLIGLPFGGLPLAVLWPLAYESKRYTKSHAITEMLSGAFAALAILLFCFIFM